MTKVFFALLKNAFTIKISVTNKKIPSVDPMLLHNCNSVRQNWMVLRFAFFFFFQTKSKRNESTPEAHWRPKIEFSLMSHNFVFDKTQIPREIFPHLR